VIYLFVENVLLVCIGIVGVLGGFYLFSYQLQSVFTRLGFASSTEWVMTQDISVLFISGFVGVFFAMMPIGFAMKKPAGLILQ
jgi:hypothetical protein